MVSLQRMTLCVCYNLSVSTSWYDISCINTVTTAVAPKSKQFFLFFMSYVSVGQWL